MLYREFRLQRWRISKEVLEQAIPSFYNRPVLGYIHKLDEPDENGNIAHIMPKVKPDTNAAQILAMI